jgi:hypothetical protein
MLIPNESDALQAGCKQAPSSAASSGGPACCLLFFDHFRVPMNPVEH